jgi:hypothetical protein
VIIPSKYLDLETSVLRLSAFLLEQLRRESIIRLTDLTARVDGYTDGRGRFNFFPAMNLLYLLGRIEFDEEHDLVRFVAMGSTEAA